MMSKIPQNNLVSSRDWLINLPDLSPGGTFLRARTSPRRYSQKFERRDFDFFKDDFKDESLNRDVLTAHNYHRHFFGFVSKSDVTKWRSYLLEPHEGVSAVVLALVTSRIDQLRQLSVEDSEPFNENSAAMLKTLCVDWRIGARPAIFLLPNGNLRMIWESPEGEQIGIQMLPDGLTQFVILRKSAKGILKTMGVDFPAALLQIISICGLRRLLNGQR